MKNKFKEYLTTFLKYIGYRIIEGKGSNKYFKVNSRKFDLYIDFKGKTLENNATYILNNLKRRKRITFWLGFRENVEINNININGKHHYNYKLHTIILPIFDYKINYVVIDKINTCIESQKLEVIINYSINIANHRDDMSTMLENYIAEDEFHLYNYWYPILGNSISIKEVLRGTFPTPDKSSYKINVSMSQDGVIFGEGEAKKRSNQNYIVNNYKDELNDIFICGGRLCKDTTYIDNIRINFHYRYSLRKNYGKSQEILFEGIRYIIDTLNNFHQEEINIYCLPIIAGGYGLDYSIIVNENYFMDSDSIDSKYKYGLVWHEFIHHWWGNRISGSGEGKYLLTEGMTVLFEWLTVRDILGKDRFDLILEDAVKEVLEITGFEKSIAEANRIPPFGNIIIYYKAPLVLYQLLNKVGEDTFIEYCRKFLGKPGNYQWMDFLTGLEVYSGINLNSFNEKWVYKKEIPLTNKVMHEILIDNRSERERKLDFQIAIFREKKDYKKLLNWLINNKPLKEFWNKYYYYLCLCYFENNDNEKANQCIQQLDIKKGKKYYWEGMYQKAAFEYKKKNMVESKLIIQNIFSFSYPIKNLRHLLIMYNEIKK
mgnify:CR=1 FL=1|jgi:hypothetical protein